MDSPVGCLALATTVAGVAAISFDDPRSIPAILGARSTDQLVRDPDRTADLRQELEEYFAGRRQRFDLQVDWGGRRGFRRAVLEDLATVPFGRAVTYGELAARAGSPRAARAVGSAMATNPIPILVPCHRVLRGGMRLGGYSGGLEVKRWLLAHEGIEPVG